MSPVSLFALHPGLAVWHSLSLFLCPTISEAISLASYSLSLSLDLFTGGAEPRDPPVSRPGGFPIWYLKGLTAAEKRSKCCVGDNLNFHSES